MARINRSEAVANRQLSATPAASLRRPYPAPRRSLPVMTVARYALGVVAVLAALSYVGVL